MKLTHVIYKLTFPNGKVYIGQTNDYSHRLATHKSASKTTSNSVNYNCLVSKAIRKYGWENVKKEIIKRCIKSRVDFWEVKFIKQFKASISSFGYNLDSGGGGKNRIVTKETIRKMIVNSGIRGKIGKNNVNSKPVLQFTLDGKLVKEWDSLGDVYRKCNFLADSISQACNGHNSTSYGFIWIFKSSFSDELLLHRLENYRKSLLGRSLSVLQIDLDGNIVQEWESIIKASSELNVSASYVSSVCNGLSNTVKRFIFMYKEDYSKDSVIARLNKVSSRYDSKSNKVYKVDAKTGKVLCEYSSIRRSAKQTGSTYSNMRELIKSGAEVNGCVFKL